MLDLVADASVHIAPAQMPEGDVAFGRIARAFGNAKWRPLGHKPLQLLRPPATSWFATALTALGPIAAAQTAGTIESLADPWRVHELRAEEGHRSLALLQPVALENEAVLVAGEVTLPVTNGRPTETAGELVVRAVPLADVPAVTSLLTDIAERLTQASMNAPDPDHKPGSVTVLGHLDRAESDALRADLWVHHRRLRAVIADPAARRDRTVRDLRKHSTNDLFVLQNRDGGRGAWSLIPELDGRTFDVILDETTAQELREEWRIWLEDADSIISTQFQGEPTPAARWVDAERKVEAFVDEKFVLTERAHKHLRGGSDYPYPMRMAEALVSLAQMARAWSAANGVVGQSLADWARTEFQIEIALHDEPLIRNQLDRFWFDGHQYSRQPHVKVDDAVPFTECGRIYFARDEDRGRFIVDHIGLHLYKLPEW